MRGFASRPLRELRVLLLLVGAALLLMGPGSNRCLAHPGNIASALAKVQPDGTFQIRLRFDLLSYALGAVPHTINDDPMNALLDGPPADLDRRLVEAKERFRQSFRVGKSGPEAIDSLTFPTTGEVLLSVKGMRNRLPVMGSVTLTGHLPPGTRNISFQFDETLGTIVLTTEFPYQEPLSEPVEAGEFSEEHRIPTPEAVAKAAADFRTPAVPSVPTVKAPQAAPEPDRKRVAQTATVAAKQPDDTLLSAPLRTVSTPTSPALPPTQIATRLQEPASGAMTGTAGTYLPATPAPTAAVAETKPVAEEAGAAKVDKQEPTPVVRWLTHVGRYIKMGYTHILPEGVDHILFVVGLFLLSTQVSALVKQVTAFTIAHSLTLALSLYGVVHLPAAFVEPAIAASIAFVAVENLFVKEMKSGRLAIVFGFGLIHGLGFAEALQSLGLQQNNLLTALFGFNIGVELGQLTVVIAAVLLAGKFRNHPNYRKFVVMPASFLIAATALFWMVQRIFFPG